MQQDLKVQKQGKKGAALMRYSDEVIEEVRARNDVVDVIGGYIHLQKKGKRAIRWACVILSMFLFWVLIYALLMMVLPQLIRSVMSIIYSFPYYVKVI